MPNRHDYAVPFAIDPASSEGAETPYAAHVDGMIRQVLLTSPGERVDQPDFGCGLRSLLFAGRSAGFSATTKILVQQSLERWLGDQIKVKNIQVPDAVALADPAEIVIEVTYQLIEELTEKQTQLRVFA